MKKTISVIVPAYNAVEVLDASLGSIAAQTTPVDEVIVVDDGSTDDTLERARRWDALLPLRVHRLEENIGAGRGAGGVRAIGIEQSSGDLIALLDADDVWFPDHVESMLRLHQTSDDLITANHVFWVPGVEVGSTPSAKLIPVPSPERQRTKILGENFVFVGTLFSRDLYDRAGPMRNIRCEDWDMWIRMVDIGAVVRMPDHVTMLYRQSSSSVSASDKLLQGEIDLLDHHLIGRTDEQAEVIQQALRRRHAKRLFLDGVALAHGGEIRQARGAWIESIRADASLRRNNSSMNGLPVLRSLVCIAAPRTMVSVRQRRQSDPSVTVGESSRNPITGIVDVLRGRSPRAK